MLAHVGECQGDVVADDILGTPREADCSAVPRVVFTDPHAASVGTTEARFSATVPVSEVAKTATYTGAYTESNGFLTLLSDGHVLTGDSRTACDRNMLVRRRHGSGGRMVQVCEPIPICGERGGS